MSQKDYDNLCTRGMPTYQISKHKYYAKWLVSEARKMPTLVTLKEITSFDTTSNTTLSNSNDFIIQPLSNYEHVSLKKKPSDHGIKLFDLKFFYY